MITSADAPLDPLLDRVLGDRYRIIARIGAGGMATVYRAEHRLLHKAVAVKVLNPELAASESMAARFEHEAITAAHLDHPNCVTITDFGRTEDQRMYLVMEHLEGATLGDLMGPGRRLPWERAVELTRQILRGLGHAHDLGIVHRDLKPGNVMIVNHTGREIAKIIDFGIAKIVDGHDSVPKVLTEAGMIFGTADFLAPERLLGKGNADPRSDLYSVGIILYDMLTGERPFHADDPYTIARRALGETARAPSLLVADLPPTLEAVVMRALEKDPDARFQNARDFLAALDPLAKKPSTVQPVVEPPTPASPTPERSLWLVATLAVLAITTIVIIGLLSSRRQEPGRVPALLVRELSEVIQHPTAPPVEDIKIPNDSTEKKKPVKRSSGGGGHF